MARCRCLEESCVCRLAPGVGITMTGTGSPASPWVISADAFVTDALLVADTTTLDLTRDGGGSTLNPYVIRGEVNINPLIDIVDSPDVNVTRTGTGRPGDPLLFTLDVLGGVVGAPVRPPISTRSATTYAPVLADENAIQLLTNAAAITVTMPSNATMAFPVGATIEFVWYGVGQPTFVAGSGATLNGTPGLKLRVRYSRGKATKLATNEWLLSGDLAV